jgi:hypothetical protein
VWPPWLPLLLRLGIRGFSTPWRCAGHACANCCIYLGILTQNRSDRSSETWPLDPSRKGRSSQYRSSLHHRSILQSASDSWARQGLNRSLAPTLSTRTGFRLTKSAQPTVRQRLRQWCREPGTSQTRFPVWWRLQGHLPPPDRFRVLHGTVFVHIRYASAAPVKKHLNACAEISAHISMCEPQHRH